MKDEYVIINKVQIQKRIEELEEEYKSEPVYQLNTYGDKLIHEIMILNEILSQSTPLFPEIEKAIQFGKDIKSEKSFINPNFDSPFVDYEDSTEETITYISNLKLDI